MYMFLRTRFLRHCAYSSFRGITRFLSEYTSVEKMSHRKSPRHAGLFVHHLDESAFFKDLAARASKIRAKAVEIELLSEYLWTSTETQQQDALNSKFIQGLRNGTLDPSNFGGYMIQDSVYCFYSKESMDVAAAKAQDQALQNFLEAKSQSYKKYYEELFTTWHIREPKGIDLNKACADYAAIEMEVAEKMTSIYLVVALIPCSRLWPWLGKELASQPHNFGVYNSWVTSNLDPTSESYKKLNKIIDDAFVLGEIDKEQALCIFKGCMNGEANFFNSV